MLNFIRQTLNPAGFHGQGRQPPYFEGWYFKLVDAAGQNKFCIIPGVFFNREASLRHAFIQVMDGSNGTSTYHTYPVERFGAASRGFQIDVGESCFTGSNVSLAIDSPERRVRAEVSFLSPVGWPVSLLSPGIMGWYAWVPFMQCYHGVISFDHELRGWMEVDGRRIDFTGGRGYIEKDWGQAFPKAWVWLQTNHFEKPRVCLTASIAHIPWMGRAFPGFIVGLWNKGELYRFATYTGAKTVSLEVDDQQVNWAVSGSGLTLEMTAHRATPGLLHAPTVTSMDRRIAETLDARVTARLYRRVGQGRSLIFSGTGLHAGLEVMGNLESLLASRL